MLIMTLYWMEDYVVNQYFFNRTYRRSIVRADFPIADAAGERAHHVGVGVDGHGAVRTRLVVCTHGAQNYE